MRRPYRLLGGLEAGQDPSGRDAQEGEDEEEGHGSARGEEPKERRLDDEPCMVSAHVGDAGLEGLGGERDLVLEGRPSRAVLVARRFVGPSGVGHGLELNRGRAWALAS
jgi:hypothetical protein